MDSATGKDTVNTSLQQSEDTMPHSSPAPHPLSTLHNSSLQKHADCIKVVFSDMEFLPWNNADNIVDAEVETISRRIKDNLVPILFAIGGPANALNMAVFYSQGLKDRVNVCLFALALADELYLSMALVYFGEQLYVQFTTGERFGPVMTFLANNHFTGLLGFGYVSNVLSAIIAIERCHCVLRPLSYQTLMRTRTMVVIVVVVYVLVIGLYSFVTFRYRIACLHDPVAGILMKTSITGSFYKAHKYFIDLLHGLFFGIGLPWVMIVVVTATTAITTLKLQQAVAWRAKTSSGLSSREVSLTKMLVANSCFFLACIFPISLLHMTWLVFPQMGPGRRQQNFFMTSLWITQGITFVNATFNFFVYYGMGSRYRETLWKLLGRKA